MMPSKTVICDVCKKEVSKRQTMSIADGKRACRIHEGVGEQAQAAQNALKKKYDDIKQKWAQKQQRYKPLPVEFNPQPKCFGCKIPGIHQQEFFLTMLLCQEKYFLTYGKQLHPFDAEECKKAYSVLQGKVCLWIVEYDPEKIKLSYNPRMAAQIAGWCALCPKCCKKFGVERDPFGDKLTLDQLANVGAAYEIYVQPAIQEMAKEELEAAN